MQWRFIAGTAFLVVGGTFISFLPVSMGQKRLHPSVVGIDNDIQPIVAIIFIFSGVYLVTQSKNLATIEKEIERVKTGEK